MKSNAINSFNESTSNNWAKILLVDGPLFLLIIGLLIYLPGCSSETDVNNLDDDIAEAQNWNYIGSTWHSKGEYDKAIKYYEKALNRNIKIFGEEHTRVGVGWSDLGAAWGSMGQYDKAIEFYEKALKILGKDNINYLSIIDSLKTVKEMRNSQSKKKVN